VVGGLRVVLRVVVVVCLSGVLSSLTFFFGRVGGIGVRCVTGLGVGLVHFLVLGVAARWGGGVFEGYEGIECVSSGCAVLRRFRTVNT
jgi:hypothetical protein